MGVCLILYMYNFCAFHYNNMKSHVECVCMRDMTWFVQPVDTGQYLPECATLIIVDPNSARQCANNGQQNAPSQNTTNHVTGNIVF